MATLSEVLKKHHRGPQSGVFTDGSAQPNPGPGGWGAVYVIDGEVVDQRYGHEPHTTNNRMELVALIEAYKMAPDGESLTIYSDSDLAVKTINEWAKGWERRGWKRKTGPIKNLELVKELYALAQSRPDLKLRWIRAHDGSLWNEYADALATAYTRKEL
ncbi:MAG: ribonuclease H [Myxococcota bacterium]